MKQYNSRAQAPCHEKVCEEEYGKSKLLQNLAADGSEWEALHSENFTSENSSHGITREAG